MSDDPARTRWRGWTTSPSRELQRPFDAAVVVATILRPTLLQSVRSIFAQDLKGRIQILIGIDTPKGDRGMIDRLRAECPSHCAITLCEPGYSTAELNGGTYSALTGGGLLAGLSTLANSRYVSYLDDDNWYAPEHLSSLRAIMNSDSGWVHSWRWFVNSYDDRPIEIDRWHAVGPDAGLYAPTMRGLVDTNCYMIDKDRCWDMLWRWSHALQKKGAGNDRGVFGALLRKEPWRCTEKATVYYRLPPEREWVIHHWKWKGIEPKADTRITPYTTIFNAAGEAYPLVRELEGQPGTPAAAPTLSPVYRTTMERAHPQDIVDLWAGDGHRSVQFALAARAAKRPLRLLAIDSWLPVPVTIDGTLRPLADATSAHRTFCRNIRDAGVDAMVRAIVQDPYEAAHLLRRTNVRMDGLTMAGDRGDPESLLRVWWPMLKRNALILVEPGEFDTDTLQHRLGDFTAARQARMGVVGDGDSRLIAIRKPESPDRLKSEAAA